MSDLDFSPPEAPPGGQLTLNKPLKSWLQLTASCNMKCKQCYGDCSTKPPTDEMSADEFKQLADEMAESGVIELLVEGGEPLHRDDYLDLLGHFTKKMMVRLRTNATLLNAKTAAELVEVGVTSVVVDFMGATPEVHDWHLGVEGAFEGSLSGLRAAREAGMEIVATLIMTRRNAGELQEFVDLMAAEGVGRVGILRLYPLGRAKEYWSEMAMSLPDQMAALDRIEVPESVYLMRSWHPRDANCCWQASGVDSTGRSVGCSYLRDFTDFGNVREVSFLSTWQHPHYRQLRSRNVESHCEECESTQGSRGGCRSTAYAFTGDWNAPDPFCTTTNRGVNVEILPTRLLPDSK
ncbi:radical SAM protein [Streptomyces sp. NPDC006333]|uniref:radical SAM protein n=1 Tax=Streptomyces sp. NPDC006333 TaxID=3156753 RepID=UPI0033A19EBE